MIRPAFANLVLALMTAAATSVLGASAAPAPIAGSTEPPGLSSGALADRQFTVTTNAGSGIARYFGNGSLDGDTTAVRAIVIVHGVLRNADTYFATGRALLSAAHADRTLLIAPQFLEASDLKGRAVPAATLRWNDDWPGGAAATAPAPISTYAVFDAMIARLADRSRFPALRDVIVIGHSAGGQIVQRYAVVGKVPDIARVRSVRIHLVVANPSSYLYFDAWRPVHEENCADVNRWRYGFAAAPGYVQGTPAALEQRYVARHVTYLLGTADTNAHEWDLDRSCAGEAQGPYRFARGKNYIAYIRARHPSGTAQDYAFVGGVGHDNRLMFTSACGIAVVFDRSRAACAGYGKI